VLVLVVLLLDANFIRVSDAQTPAALLVDPPSGVAGSRFQIVGQSGWTAGEIVDLRVGFAGRSDPATFSGPFAIDEDVTVLPDGTWSFPVVLNEAFFQGPPPAQPGAVAIQAESPSSHATAVFQYAGLGPPPASGFGPIAQGSSVALIVALFAAGIGAMLVLRGAGTPAQKRR
jgi:hypothetical protein